MQLVILFKDGSSALWSADEYDDCQYTGASLIVYRGLTTVGVYNMSEVRCMERRQEED